MVLTRFEIALHSDCSSHRSNETIEGSKKLNSLVKRFVSEPVLTWDRYETSALSRLSGKRPEKSEFYRVTISRFVHLRKSRVSNKIAR